MSSKSATLRSVVTAFSLATGLRESNVRLLKWEQVDLARNLAWIEADETKPGKALSVPLNQDAIEVLIRVRNDHPVYAFVWENHEGKKNPVRNCSSPAWYKAVKRAGLEGFRWHDLRHTWASWHVQRGTPLTTLMELGGWSSYEMVLKYAHIGQSHTSAYADNSSLRFKSGTTLDDRTLVPAAKPAPDMGWLMGNHSITVKPSIGAGLQPVATRRRVASSVALLVSFRSKFEAARLTATGSKN